MKVMYTDKTICKVKKVTIDHKYVMVTHTVGKPRLLWHDAEIEVLDERSDRI